LDAFVERTHPERRKGGHTVRVIGGAEIEGGGLDPIGN